MRTVRVSAADRRGRARSAGTPGLVPCPTQRCLVAEGEGGPRSSQFKAAVRAIYSVAYTLKMQLKIEGKDFQIEPTEAIWWTDGGAEFELVPQKAWHWKLQLPVPETVDGHLVALVKQSLVARRRLDAASDVHLDEVDEGPPAEALTAGPAPAPVAAAGPL